MPFEKSAGAIIFRREKDKIYYLVLSYISGSRMPGKICWDFPKGHIEKGETEIETAKREAGEETGIKDLKFIKGFKEEIKYSFKVEKNNTLKTVIFYLAETITKEVKISHEHIDYKWLPYKQALTQLTFGNTKAILKKAHKILLKEKNKK